MSQNYEITLTKKYRIWWDEFTLNIPTDHTKEYSEDLTLEVIQQPPYSVWYESDNLQDILDKIETEQLNVLGEHVDYNLDI